MLHPALVFPIHDPDGLIFHHLKDITPILKQHFSSAFLGITAITYEKYQPLFHTFEQDDFFQLLITPRDAQIGRQFKLLYQRAASLSKPDQILHLCYPDRLALRCKTSFESSFWRILKPSSQNTRHSSSSVPKKPGIRIHTTIMRLKVLSRQSASA